MMTTPKSSPTIQGEAVGFNCLLTATGYGKRVVRCIGISYGVDIVSSEDEMRDQHAFYTLNVVDSDFDLYAAFISQAERETFAHWLSGWASAVSANQPISGYLSVSIPTRNFLRRAVWEGGLIYGDQIGSTSWPLALHFIGASDPLSAVGKTNVTGDSFVETATRDTTAAPYYDPSYYVNGATGDTIYDNPVGPTGKQLQIIKSLTGQIPAGTKTGGN